MSGYAEAAVIDRSAIPIIDIEPLRKGTDPAAVSAALHEASRKVGFIYVEGHGIEPDLLDSTRETALGFFRQPQDRKDEIRISPQHRGWLGRGGAKMRDDAKTDLKESFVWGHEDPSGNTPSDHPLRGANQWPNSAPALRDAATNWFTAAHEVAHHLMRGFALGLGLDEGFFLRSAGAPMSRASFVYYPPQPPEMGGEQFGVGPHTDFGVLTVLAQDSVGGLQVQRIDGTWIEAPPIPGTLVVNVGDLLARWTNDAYRSTPHRVVNSSGRERLSLVLAFDPEPSTRIDPREIFPSEATDYEATTCGDYLEWRFAKAFAYRKAS